MRLSLDEYPNYIQNSTRSKERNELIAGVVVQIYQETTQCQCPTFLEFMHLNYDSNKYMETGWSKIFD